MISLIAASTSAMESMVKVLAAKFSRDNMRVNGIASGFIDSEMSRPALNSDSGHRNRAMYRPPTGRFGEAEDIGLAAVLLASDATRYIIGAALPVDGGNSTGF